MRANSFHSPPRASRCRGRTALAVCCLLAAASTWATGPSASAQQIEIGDAQRDLARQGQGWTDFTWRTFNDIVDTVVPNANGIRTGIARFKSATDYLTPTKVKQRILAAHRRLSDYLQQNLNQSVSQARDALNVGSGSPSSAANVAAQVQDSPQTADPSSGTLVDRGGELVDLGDAAREVTSDVAADAPDVLAGREVSPAENSVDGFNDLIEGREVDPRDNTIDGSKDLIGGEEADPQDRTLDGRSDLLGEEQVPPERNTFEPFPSKPSEPQRPFDEGLQEIPSSPLLQNEPAEPTEVSDYSEPAETPVIRILPRESSPNYSRPTYASPAPRRPSSAPIWRGPRIANSYGTYRVPPTPPNYGPGTGRSGPEGQRLYVHEVPYGDSSGGYEGDSSGYSPKLVDVGDAAPRDSGTLYFDDNAPRSGPTNRFGYDDYAPKEASPASYAPKKGVLMRLGIDPATLERGEAPTDLLSRLRGNS